MAALAFTSYGGHWFAIGWNRLPGTDPRVNVGMTIAFLLISILGVIVFFRVGDAPAAADYLATAEPANRRLDAEVQSYADHEHRNLAAAEAALRAEAVTERRFDQCLLKIPIPPPAAATARALVRANERRAELAVRQAGSPSLVALQSFTRRHQSADAAVEAQVKAIRRALGLPPPKTS